MTPDRSKFLNAAAFARELGVSQGTVLKWINARVIPYIRIKRLILIDPLEARKALDRFKREPIEIKSAKKPLDSRKRLKVE